MRWLLALAAAVVCASPALALTVDKREVVCPVGGETFEATMVMSASTFGMNFDLKPIGATLAPWPLADCPANGFVFAPGQEFSSEEILALEPVVASTAFQELRGETPYFRQAHILAALAKPTSEVVDALLQATWEAEEDPSRYDRYAKTLLVQLETAIAEGGENIVSMQLLKIEMLRRTSDFVAAGPYVEAVLASLPADHELRWVADFQKSLIENSDSATHAISEAQPAGTP